MKVPQKKSRSPAQLKKIRRQAEALLERLPPETAELEPADVQKLLQELHRHQVELQLKHDELRRVQSEAETARERLAMLYDYAPVGYLTLGGEGFIQDANLTVAAMLGLRREDLTGKKFAQFIPPDAQEALGRHLKEAHATRTKQTCQLRVCRKGAVIFIAELESIVVQDRHDPEGREKCLVTLSDITQRKIVEAELRESRTQLAGIISSSMNAIITVDEDQLILIFNPAAERAFGWRAAEVLGRPLISLVPERLRHPPGDHVHLFGETSLSREPRGTYNTIIGLRADGTEFPLEVSVSEFQSGGRKYYTAILADITERLRSEAERRQLAEIVQYSSDSIIGRNLDDTISSWNFGAERMFGYRAEEVLGRPFAMLTPPNRRGELQEIRQQLERGEHIELYETLRVSKGGRKVWVSVNSSPIKDAGGKLTGIATIARDITRQREAEAALHLSERNLADFFDESPLGLLWVGPKGRVLRINRAQLELLGCTNAEMSGQPISKFLAEPELVNDLLARLAKKETIQNYRVRLRGKAGKLLHVLIDANGLWEHGRLVHSRWFVRDITRRRELEREILAISEQEKRRLGRDLHDDLGQQLAGIEFLTQTLAHQLAATAPANAGEARKIARMVQRTMVHTRNLARGLSPVNLETDGLVTALRDLTVTTGKLFQIDCRFRCRTPVLIHDEALGIHLYRIAQEAVSNAIRHGKAKRIDIHLTVSRRQLVMEVRDNGTGMPKNPGSRKGMGLRLMHYRAGVIGGSLVVRPLPDAGTAFVCTIKNPFGESKSALKS